MAFRHGKGSYFALATQGTPGTTVNISSYTDEVTLPRDVDMAEVTAFGDTVKKYIPGLPDSQISLGGHWDSTLDAQLAALVGFDTAVNWQYGPEGNAAGRVRYAGTCFLSGYETSSPVGDKVSYSASLQQAGAITRDTWP